MNKTLRKCICGKTIDSGDTHHHVKTCFKMRTHLNSLVTSPEIIKSVVLYGVSVTAKNHNVSSRLLKKEMERMGTLPTEFWGKHHHLKNGARELVTETAVEATDEQLVKAIKLIVYENTGLKRLLKDKETIIERLEKERKEG